MRRFKLGDAPDPNDELSFREWVKESLAEIERASHEEEDTDSIDNANNSLQIDNNLSDVADANAAFDNIAQFSDATDVLTGTDATEAVTPDALAALWEKATNVASAATLSLGEGGYFHVTGTTTITDIDFATATDGRTAVLVFDGVLTLTHNASTLIIPGGASITTAAGDSCVVVQDASDNVKVLSYTRADGKSVIAPTILDLTDSPSSYTGQEGKILKVNGTPDAMEFTEQGWETISEGSITSATQYITFSGLTEDEYDEYEVIVLNAIPATDGVEWWCQFSQAATWETGSSDYGWARDGEGDSDPQGIITYGVGNGSSEGLYSCRAWLPRFTTDATRKHLTYNTVFFSSYFSLFAFTNGYVALTNGASTDACDGIRFYFDSGNITSCEHYMLRGRKW